MANTSRAIHFNALPEPARQRFVACVSGQAAPAPLWSQRSGGIGGAIGFFFLAALLIGGVAVIAAQGFGRYYYSSNQQNFGHLLGYVVLGWLAFWAGLAGVKSFFLTKLVPFQPGAYLFATDYIDATKSVIEVTPMTALGKPRIIHRYRNGAYMGTTVELPFTGAPAKHLYFARKEDAEAAVNALFNSLNQIAQAAQRGDTETIAKFDPLFDAKVSGHWDQFPAAPPPPAAISGTSVLAGDFHVLLTRAPIVALAVALAFGIPAFLIRNIGSDEGAFAAASAEGLRGEPFALEAYLRCCTRHAQEVRDELLPRAAFAQAQATGSVTALRNYVNRYPASRYANQARIAIHQRFVSFFAAFSSQAAADDPRMLPFMERLLVFLEANNSPPVQLRFVQPTTSALAEIDARLATMGLRLRSGRTIVPISRYFGASSVAPHEREISSALESSFGALFPTDVMSIQHGSEVGQPSVSPTIDVSYAVSPSGSVFTEESTNRAFVGIAVTFSVAMRIPGDMSSFDFPLQVQAPHEFSVRYNRSSGGPSEGAVYETMAERAFDQLRTKLRSVFFRQGTEGFQGRTRTAGTTPRTSTPPRRTY